MNNDNQHALEELLRKLLTPRGFFVGVVLGFAACCVAGRKAPTLLPMADFQRFHRFLSPEGLYYPTALQVRALARHELPRDKIAVIIGGTSVMQGVGQNARAAWHLRLQQELGDEYRVLNLAMRGGAPNEHGQIAAEMMLRDGRRVIHVCDALLTGFADAPDGNRDVYRYLFHDARARDLLLPLAERDREIARLTGLRRDNTFFEELHIQTRANRWLSFNDLWHVVGYEHAFTVWQAFARHGPWRPRRLGDDRPVDVKRFELRERGLAAVAALARPYSPQDWAGVQAQVRQTVPQALRLRTLVVVNRLNPEYVQTIEQASPGFEARYRRKIREALAHLRKAGLNAVEGCVTLEPADFMDFNHLFAGGGNKLAVELAPHIRELARDLGYLSSERIARQD